MNKRKPGGDLKYGEETVHVTFRCPKSKKEEFKDGAYKILDLWALQNKSIKENGSNLYSIYFFSGSDKMWLIPKGRGYVLSLNNSNAIKFTQSDLIKMLITLKNEHPKINFYFEKI